MDGWIDEQMSKMSSQIDGWIKSQENKTKNTHQKGQLFTKQAPEN